MLYDRLERLALNVTDDLIKTGTSTRVDCDVIELFGEGAVLRISNQSERSGVSENTLDISITTTAGVLRYNLRHPMVKRALLYCLKQVRPNVALFE